MIRIMAVMVTIILFLAAIPGVSAHPLENVTSELYFQGSGAPCTLTTWIGNNSNWSDANNWSDCQPTGGVDVIIPSTPSGGKFPVLDTSPSTITVKNLTLEPGSSLNLNGNTLIVTGVLSNSGTLIQTKDIQAFDNVEFFDTGGYKGISINSTDEAPGLTTVKIRGKQLCDSDNTSLQRCFDISPTVTDGILLNVLFYFTADELVDGVVCDPDTLRVYHNTGSQWEEIWVQSNLTQCTTEPYYIVAVDITSFSDFVVANTLPTAVTLRSMEASLPGADGFLLPAIILLVLLGIGTILVLYKRKASQPIN